MKRKQLIRKNFRDSVFKRDNFTCQVCGASRSTLAKLDNGCEQAAEFFDAHHITDRTKMPNGGYVKENGITVCKDKCHMAVETWHIALTKLGYTEEGARVLVPQDLHPESLYEKIGSSYEKAVKKSEKLNVN